MKINLNQLQNKPKEELEKIAKAVEQLAQHARYNKLEYMFPDEGPLQRSKYPNQVKFMASGKDHRFRMILGGNRTGKTQTGVTELGYHVTGLYPKWWEGRVFRNIKTVWIVCESGALYRDSVQKLLFGNPGEEIGTGLLPKESIVSTHAMPGIGGAIGSAIIKHKKGHAVSINVKTYEMGREQFQAAKVDLVVFDEEPPMDIYGECLLRLMGAGKEPGISIIMETPMKGFSDVINEYLVDGSIPYSGKVPGSPDKWVTQLTWENDAPHLTEEDRRQMLATIPVHLRGARTKGLPTLGSGQIYPIDEDFITVRPFVIPDYYKRAFGLDFGWNNTAVIWGAEDPSTHTIYLYAEYKRGEQIPAIHVQAIKAKGDWIKGIADPSGGGRNNRDGSMLIDEFRALGLRLYAGDNSIQSGIAKVLSAFESGRLKIFSNLYDTFSELRVYRYDTKNPNIPAPNQKDHLMDAIRYLISMFDYYATSELDHDNETYAFQQQDYSSFHNSRDSTTGY